MYIYSFLQHLNLYLFMYIYIYTYIHTYIYIHTHTHTLLYQKLWTIFLCRFADWRSWGAVLPGPVERVANPTNLPEPLKGSIGYYRVL